MRPLDSHLLRATLAIEVGCLSSSSFVEHFRVKVICGSSFSLIRLYCLGAKSGFSLINSNPITCLSVQYLEYHSSTRKYISRGQTRAKKGGDPAASPKGWFRQPLTSLEGLIKWVSLDQLCTRSISLKLPKDPPQALKSWEVSCLALSIWAEALTGPQLVTGDLWCHFASSRDTWFQKCHAW